MEGLIDTARDDSLSTAFSDLKFTAAVDCTESTVIFNNHPTIKSSDFIAGNTFLKYISMEGSHSESTSME